MGPLPPAAALCFSFKAAVWAKDQVEADSLIKGLFLAERLSFSLEAAGYGLEVDWLVGLLSSLFFLAFSGRKEETEAIRRPTIQEPPNCGPRGL